METRLIAKLFTGYNVKIAFQTSHTQEKQQCSKRPVTVQYDKSRVHRLKCHECAGRYIGQTGRTFKVRYHEHIPAIRKNNEISGYSQHILNPGHSYSRLENTL